MEAQHAPVHRMKRAGAFHDSAQLGADALIGLCIS